MLHVLDIFFCVVFQREANRFRFSSRLSKAVAVKKNNTPCFLNSEALLQHLVSSHADNFSAHGMRGSGRDAAREFSQLIHNSLVECGHFKRSYRHECSRLAMKCSEGASVGPL
jgi:hypothetical protein